MSLPGLGLVEGYGGSLSAEDRCLGSHWQVWEEDLLGDPTVCKAASGVAGKPCSGKKVKSSHLNLPPLPHTCYREIQKALREWTRTPTPNQARKADVRLEAVPRTDMSSRPQSTSNVQG